MKNNFIKIMMKSIIFIIICINIHISSGLTLFEKYREGLEKSGKIELTDFKNKTIGSLLDSMGCSFLTFNYYCMGDRIDINIFHFYYQIKDSLFLRLRISTRNFEYLMTRDNSNYALYIDKDLLRFEIIESAILYREINDINRIADFIENEAMAKNKVITMFLQNQEKDFVFNASFKRIKEYQLNELRIYNYFTKLCGSKFNHILEIIGNPDYYYIENILGTTWIELRYNYDQNFSVLIAIKFIMGSEKEQIIEFNDLLSLEAIEIYVSPIPITKRNDLIPFNK